MAQTQFCGTFIETGAGSVYKRLDVFYSQLILQVDRMARLVSIFDRHQCNF